MTPIVLTAWSTPLRFQPIVALNVIPELNPVVEQSGDQWRCRDVTTVERCFAIEIQRDVL
jgi:hypothetical protein